MTRLDVTAFLGATSKVARCPAILDALRHRAAALSRNWSTQSKRQLDWATFALLGLSKLGTAELSQPMQTAGSLHFALRSMRPIAMLRSGRQIFRRSSGDVPVTFCVKLEQPLNVILN
jgi:hypothetical protein